MIDKNKHYFVLLHPLEEFFGITFTSSSSREKWVECEIIEKRYKISDGYKVELKPIEDGYGNEIFYQSDFESLINTGIIIPKINENQHVEEIEWIEQFHRDLFIKHNAYIIKN